MAKSGTRDRRVWLAAILLFLAAAAVYANSLSGVFFFDDANAIESNPVIRGLWPPSRFLSAPAESPANGRPLASFTFALSYAAGGLTPFAFRLGGLIVHALAGIALFLALRAAFTAPRMPAELRGSSLGLAFASALLWTVHPLQSECLNYVSQRTESLMGLFFFLTVHASLRALERPRFGALAFLWCLAGMLSKEIMLAAPPLIWLFDRTFVYGSFREALRTRLKLYLALASTGLVVFWLMTTRPRSGTVGLELGLSAWDWVLNQAPMLRTYLVLLVWPDVLSVDYGMPRPLSFADVRLDAVLIWGLAVLTLVALWRRPRLGFPLVWFFVVLAPTSSFIPIVTEVGAERRVYVALAPLVAFLVCAAWCALRRLCPRTPGRLALPLVALVTLGLSARTIQRNRDYATDVTVWASAVRSVPDNARAHVNLAYALHGERRLEEALVHYDEALRLRTTPLDGVHRANANFNAGVIHRDRGELEKALQRFRRALRTRPRSAEAHYELGFVQGELARYRPAAQSFRAALDLKPDSAQAALRLGMCLQELGDAAGALDSYRRTLSIQTAGSIAEEARRRIAVMAGDSVGSQEEGH